MISLRVLRALPLALGALLLPSAAQAFCGFYVSGADAKLFNNATMVVMMRDGTRTVLAMQNNYQGPPSDFAMVVPVPVVLQKENVKTLPREIFDKVDTLTAPRLVESWEMDPCMPNIPPPMPAAAAGAGAPEEDTAANGLGVKVEAQFTVAEYDVVVLSASDSSGLDTWLRGNRYAIPPGAEPYLRPYVQSGSKFFVAKVDARKVQFDPQGHTMLSPLRFHYDTDTFTLPIRLGLINSSGTQDLIVNILARGKRYEVANYPNVTIPTNIEVAENAKQTFGPFYAALFDKTIASHPKAVVTEYSWDSSSCDPCPLPPLDDEETATLGGDVAPGGNGDFVLTRLHARYTRDTLGDDLVFHEAPAIVGGRETPDENGSLPKGAQPDDENNFQGRYMIRHRWAGPIKCEHPIRNRWGGPPGDDGNGVASSGAGNPVPASRIAFAPRGGVRLGMLVREDVPEIGLKQGDETPSTAAPPPATAPSGAPAIAPPVAAPRSGGCAGCTAASAPETATLGALAAALAAALSWLRRRR